ncbi:telomeric repeat-binding factor 2-like [Branchiostoma lanceolatum]|uniref:telomeric repeat-binding factor 2-like n=1 Tax=Branchiostoma lanceolatum TaxID=7740 RepID=UPI0034525AFD
MAESVNPEDAVANGWILEFVCYTTWKEFVAGDDCFYQGRDFLQGLLARSVESSPERQRRVKLIQLLCRLADGRDHGIRYDEDGDITALESSLPIFDALVETADLPADQVAHARGLMKVQSVLVCCRDNDFEAAEEVFQRVWPAGSKQSAKDKKLRTEVNAVLKSRNPHHPVIQNRCPYDQFLQIMADFLQPIVDDFNSPFLLKAAQRVVRDRIKAADSTESEVLESESDSDAYETPSENETHPEGEEFVFRSRRLLRECFMVMAKEERSSAEWRKDIVDYDYSNLARDLSQTQDATASKSTVRRSPRKHRPTEEEEKSEPEASNNDKTTSQSRPKEMQTQAKASKSTVRTSPRKHKQTEEEEMSEPEASKAKSRPKKQTASEGTTAQGLIPSDSERKHRQTEEEETPEPEATKSLRQPKKQTASEGATAQGLIPLPEELTNRLTNGQTEKRKHRDSEEDWHRDPVMNDQPSTSGLGKKVNSRAKYRRVIQDDDSESEDEFTRENAAAQRSKFKKWSRGNDAYGNGVKETWSSDEETFRSPVKKKYYVYESDSEEEIPTNLPCTAASLHVPVIPARLRMITKSPPDITRKGYLRQRHQWTDSEVENLIKGVKKYGLGNWAKIKDNFRFNGRTNVNLKDKWRQLIKSGAVKEFP